MQYEMYARNPNLYKQVDTAISHFYSYSKPGEAHREKITYANSDNIPYIEHYLFNEEEASVLIAGIPLAPSIPSVELETETDLMAYFDVVNDPISDGTYTRRIETDELPQFEYFANLRFSPRQAVADLTLPSQKEHDASIKIKVNTFRETIEFELEGNENLSHNELQEKMIQAEDFLYGLLVRMHKAVPSRAFAHQIGN